jgi:Helix-turn-helix domain of resolvase
MSRGKQPKLSASQRSHLLELHDAGIHTQEELAELFSVSRTTVYGSCIDARPQPCHDCAR